MRSERTQVAIVGAGPAGLLLGQLLHRAGVDAVILEARDRSHCEARIRAGMLEQGTVETLREAGVGERLDREGLVHEGIHLNVDGVRHRIPITELTGGRTVTVYGQTEIVKDLIAARAGAGLPLRFAAEKVTLHDLSAPRLTYRHGGCEHELRAEYVAGCDGFHGICRAAIPAGALTVHERAYPFAWLGILADVAPSTDELIYAHHERGFALHSMRSPRVSRLYIQVPPDADLDAWSDGRVWEELHARLHCAGWTLRDGPVTDKSITPMRSFVVAPMRHERLLLAGDAAHIVPPTGAKGLNLAVADVTVLAQALIAALTGGHAGDLDAYSQRCLRRVWRAQHFSWWMTMMLHTDPHADPYERALQRAQLEYVVSSDAAARTLAENYAGLPLAGAEHPVPSHG